MNKCSLQMFEGTVAVVKSIDDWNAFVCLHHGKQREQLPERLFVDDDCQAVGYECRLAKTEHGPTTFLIGVFDGRIRTFVHELAHVVFDICGYYQIPAREDEANEFYCYCYDFLFDRFQPDFS
jgi:hypothetical protein